MTDKQPASAPATDQSSLSEVMLAMDVVDTLRHEQALVESALNEDQRDAAFIERIKTIYAKQGIEVTDQVIADGVEALKKDRFVYQPPKHGLQTWLAGLYVKRGKVIKVFGLLLAVLGIGWGAVKIPQSLYESHETEKVQAQIDTLQSRYQTAAGKLDHLNKKLSSLNMEGLSPTTVNSLKQRIQTKLNDAEQALEYTAKNIPRNVDNIVASAPAKAMLNSADSQLNKALNNAENALNSADDHLTDISSLASTAAKLSAIKQSVRSAHFAPNVQGQIQQQINRADQAVTAGNARDARLLTQNLEAQLSAVQQSYTLRIVNQSGVQSGLWRYPNSNSRARNYYLVVDAIDNNGQPVRLPITSEETQATETVSRFAVRVPRQVFERVKADKQDNGLIDNNIIARKRAGELKPQFTVKTDGGYITQW